MNRTCRVQRTGLNADVWYFSNSSWILQFLCQEKVVYVVYVLLTVYCSEAGG